ncbi:MAG: hypothetical protein ACR2FN_10245 [Chitinophagaceae bacterium]
MLSFENFQQSISDNKPPEKTSVYLLALWYDAKGNWQTAHEIIQDINDKNAAWIHAYLHRKEGDISNANYWYNKAKKNMPLFSLQEEWKYIVQYLLNEELTA